ncbi:MAG: hypothetical protein HS116_25170 [Planctomycetes bacterium]|nr:hypothetical protein [Planctomycetota bacterium]
MKLSDFAFGSRIADREDLLRRLSVALESPVNVRVFAAVIRKGGTVPELAARARCHPHTVRRLGRFMEKRRVFVGPQGPGRARIHYAAGRHLIPDLRHVIEQCGSERKAKLEIELGLRPNPNRKLTSTASAVEVLDFATAYASRMQAYFDLVNRNRAYLTVPAALLDGPLQRSRLIGAAGLNPKSSIDRALVGRIVADLTEKPHEIILLEGLKATARLNPDRRLALAYCYQSLNRRQRSSLGLRLGVRLQGILRAE